MRLLDRYLLRELAVPLSYCLIGFYIFWISFDLLSELDEFQSAKLSAGEIVLYYAYKTPELLVTVLPVALLLGLLYALTTHARHNEIVAMRAAGISLFRLSLPYLAVGLLFTFVLFFLNEVWIARNAGAAERITRRKTESKEDLWVHNVHFRNAAENRIWSIQKYNTKTGEMITPQVEWALPDGTQKKVFAKHALLQDGAWNFFDAELFSYSPGRSNIWDRFGVRTNRVSFPEFQETPREIALQLRFQRMNAMDAAKRVQLTLDEIKYLRDHVELNKRDRAMLETQYHARLAKPWTCLVVVLLALPFGTLTGRRNVFAGVAGSIFIVFIYFIIDRFGLAMGVGGFIPAYIAAWLPNTIFAATGLWLTLRIK